MKIELQRIFDLHYQCFCPGHHHLVVTTKGSCRVVLSHHDRIPRVLPDVIAPHTAKHHQQMCDTMSKNLCVCVNCAFNLLENSGNSEKKKFSGQWVEVSLHAKLNEKWTSKQKLFFFCCQKQIRIFFFPHFKLGVLLLLSFFKSFILQCLYCLPSAPLGATSYKFSTHHQLLN